jgi:hypothetical protein
MALLLAAAMLTTNSAQAVVTTTVIDDFYSVQSPDSPWDAWDASDPDPLDETDPQNDSSSGLWLKNFLETHAAPTFYPLAGAVVETGLSHVLGGTRHTKVNIFTNSFDDETGSHDLRVEIVNVGSPGGANPGDPVNSFMNFQVQQGVMAGLGLGYKPTLGAAAADGTIIVNLRSHETGGPDFFVDLLVRQGALEELIPAHIYPLQQSVSSAGPTFPLNFDLEAAALAGINFANPVDLQFLFRTTEDAQDFSLKSIVLETEQTEGVPEPSTLWIAALGLAGAGGYGWLRRYRTQVQTP